MPTIALAAGSNEPLFVVAQAQDDDEEDDEDEVIIVRGTRAALASALDRRRNAGTISDSIVAEDVSDFPDKNIGEAVARAPGVQLTRDFGEGATISIRGTAPDLNRVEINGVSALSSSGTNSRATDFREFASELVAAVDVFKGATADMTEGGVGGTVRVILRKPLELNDRLLVVNAAAQNMNTRDDWTPRINVTYGDKWLDDKFGVILNLTYDDVQTRGDLARNTEWVLLADWDDSAEKTFVNPDFADVTTQAGCDGDGACLEQWFDYSPRIPRYGLWTRDDERISAQLTAQYQVTDKLDFVVDYNYNEREQFLSDMNYVTELTSTGRFLTVDGEPQVTVDENHNVIGATYANVDRMFGTEQRAFNLDIESQYLSFGANYRGDTIEAEFLYGHAENEYLRRTNRALFAARLDGLRLELDPDNGIPNIIFPESFDQKDPNNYNYIQLDWRPGIEENSEDVFKADFDWDPGLEFISTVEFGTQYKEFQSTAWGGGGYYDGERDLYVPTLNITHRAWTANSSNPEGFERTGNTTNDTLSMWRYYDQQQIQDAVAATETTSPDFFPEYDLNAPIPTNWLTADYEAVADYIVQGGVFDGDPLFDTTYFTLDQVKNTTVDGVTYRQLPVDLQEDVTALYAMGNFETEVASIGITGNFGVRYVHTDVTATGVLTTNLRTENEDSTDETPTSTVNLIDTDNATLTRDYTDWLPSFNANVNFTEQFVMRLGASRNLSRPPINDLRPSGNCTFNDEDLTPSRFPDIDDDCNVGNPALEPYRSWNYDVEWAYYPTDESEIRFGLFYKDISSYVVGSSTVQDIDFFGDGRLIDVTQPINGEGANNFGYEISAQTPFTFLPAPFDGFGGQVNYTFSDADEVGLFSPIDGSELPQVGQSKHSYNITGYYDKGRVNARLAYAYRSEFLLVPFDREGNSVFEDESGYLDGSIRFDVTDTVEVYVEGKNLTDEVQRRVANESAVRLTEVGWYGRRYFIGAKFNF